MSKRTINLNEKKNIFIKRRRDKQFYQTNKQNKNEKEDSLMVIFLG